MSMTRRNYDAIAAIIRKVADDHPRGTGRDFTAREAVARITSEMASHMWEDNRHFNGQKFIDACGLGDMIEWHEGFSYQEARMAVK